MRVHLLSPEASYAGADLPWDMPLAQWPAHLFVTLPRGISRNLVRFAVVEGHLLAIKEISDHAAAQEYRLLRSLRDLSLPAVEPVALVTERESHSRSLMGLIITRYLNFSLPYRLLLSRLEPVANRDRLLDALVDLMVQLHLAGFYWGDCSLSNTLFKRDAGRLAAYLVDAETGELHPSLSEGMRRYDVEQAEENIAGELMDVAAERGLPENMDPIDTAEEFAARYHRLWCELDRDEVFERGEIHQVETRIKKLNELGFDVEELEMITQEDGHRLSMRAKVVEPGYHKKLLHSLIGLVAQENQSRQLLNDIYRFRAWLENTSGKPIPKSQAASRWLNQIYQPAIDAIPSDLRGKLDGPEIFHQILEHRWFMSEKAGRDVGTDEALQSYKESILPKLPPDNVTRFWEDGSQIPSNHGE